MKKRILVVLSLLSIGTFAYGSAIVSTGNSSLGNSMIKNQYGSLGSSSIMNSSIYTKSNIQTGNIGNAANVYKQFSNDKGNINYAIDAFRACLSDGKYKQAANILTEYYISSKGSREALDYDNASYLQKVTSSLKQEINNSASNPDIYALMGSILLLSGDKDSAISYVSKAKEISPAKYSALLGKMYYINGETQKAYELLDAHLQKYPSDYDALYYKTKILMKQGNVKEAVNNCHQLASANKYTNEVTAMLFPVLDQQNVSNENIIKTLLPKNPGISVEKGYDILIPKMIKLHEYEVAEKMIFNSESYNSENVNLYLTAAEAYAENGEIQRARNYLEKSKRLLDSEEDISRYNLVSASFAGEKLKGARDLALSGKYDDAIKVYEKSKTPDSVETLLGLANSYAGMGDDTKALSYLNKAMTMYPDNAEVYYSFAKYFSDKNDIETANKYINNALRLAPKNQKIVSLSNQLKGQKVNDLFDEAFSAFDTQNYQETLSILNKISKIEPDNYTVYYYKGLTYGNMNNYSAAISEFMKAKNLNPQFVFVNYLLGVAYDNLNETNEAKKYYNLYVSNEHNVTNENSEYINYAKSRLQKL